MTIREHAVDPSTLDPKTWVEVAYPQRDGTRVWRAGDVPPDGAWRIIAVLHRADECPPAEQWRQVTPEEVQKGWTVERRHEPADPDAEKRRDAWFDYRKDYGVEDVVTAKKAFDAGWAAAQGTLDAGGPLR